MPVETWWEEEVKDAFNALFAAMGKPLDYNATSYINGELREFSNFYPAFKAEMDFRVFIYTLAKQQVENLFPDLDDDDTKAVARMIFYQLLAKYHGLFEKFLHSEQDPKKWDILADKDSTALVKELSDVKLDKKLAINSKKETVATVPTKDEHDSAEARLVSIKAALAAEMKGKGFPIPTGGTVAKIDALLEFASQQAYERLLATVATGIIPKRAATIITDATQYFALVEEKGSKPEFSIGANAAKILTDMTIMPEVKDAERAFALEVYLWQEHTERCARLSSAISQLDTVVRGHLEAIQTGLAAEEKKDITDVLEYLTAAEPGEDNYATYLIKLNRSIEFLEHAMPTQNDGIKAIKAERQKIAGLISAYQDQIKMGPKHAPKEPVKSQHSKHTEYSAVLTDPDNLTAMVAVVMHLAAEQSDDNAVSLEEFAGFMLGSMKPEDKLAEMKKIQTMTMAIFKELDLYKFDRRPITVAPKKHNEPKHHHSPHEKQPGKPLIAKLKQALIDDQKHKESQRKKDAASKLRTEQKEAQTWQQGKRRGPNERT